MFFSQIIRKKFDAVLGRYDGSPACFYYSPCDFPGMKSESCDIPGDHGVTLKGYFYYYGTLNADRLVVFDHGIGAGHLAYFKEIEMLAKQGYTVYSYDHTGCVDSGGTGILGFAQGINDLDHVLTALKQDERFASVPVRLVGHSWGGYAAMNAAALHPEVTHIVSLAGFVSARSLIEQYLPNFVMRYSGEVMERERAHNPAYADMDARESLKKTEAKLLYMQSEDDRKVRYDLGYLSLSRALKDRENTTFLSVKNRNHEPHHTEQAAAAYAAFSEKLEKLTKKKKLSTPDAVRAFREGQDWAGMTEQDPVIWEKIFRFLES